MKGDSDSRIIKYCTLRVPWVMVELREYCNSTLINSRSHSNIVCFNCLLLGAQLSK